MLIGSLSLIATPYLSGFYSKDLILELAIAQWTIPSTWMWLIGSFVAGLTACYIIRLLAYIYLGTPTGPRKTYEMSHEQPFGIVIPIVFLSLLAISFGYISREATVGLGNSFSPMRREIISSYDASTASSYLIEADFGIAFITKNLPLIFTGSGVLLGFLFFILIPALNRYSSSTNIIVSNLVHTRSSIDESNFSLGQITDASPLMNRSFPIHHAHLVLGLSNKWWIDALYARYLTWPGLYIGLLGSKVIDRGVLELLGPAGVTSILVGNTTYNNWNVWSLSNLTRSLPHYTGPQEVNSEKNESLISNWIGTTLPDYSSYIVVFALVTILGILWMNPIDGELIPPFYLLPLVLWLILITSTVGVT